MNRDRAIKETEEERLVRLCLDLNAWQIAVCPAKDEFIAVIVRVLSAYLCVLPDEARKKVFETLINASNEDHAKFLRWQVTGKIHD